MADPVRIDQRPSEIAGERAWQFVNVVAEIGLHVSSHIDQNKSPGVQVSEAYFCVYGHFTEC